MSQDVRIALDAMGGDYGAAVVVPGAAKALEQYPSIRFLFFGDEAVVGPLVAAHPALEKVSVVRHAAVAIKMDEKPSQALRAGRRVSSMWMAIEAVKAGQADAAVSAGNTGALMAMAKVCLRTMPNVDRPAIAAMWPTLRGVSIVLDVGASIGADAQHLVDLAVMGAAMAKIVLSIDRPSVGLLNVGVEEIKGLEEIKAAGRLLKDAALPGLVYHGFVEGDDLGKGTVDVVVTEGFTGNIALKTAEGTAKQIGRYVREAMSQSLMSKLGYWLARGAFATLRQKMDPRRVNGGVFLGLDGVVIKSHGSTDALGYARAIGVGYEMANHDLLSQIRESMALVHEISAPGSGSLATPDA
ncbi:MAG TPA: phosphate acyltransferase PlsX [Lichenihabitans sp.]|jgi:glycerol-3-phosphate acyltransferase PlsX|nr:phosphate acyltransferase PlsX [Lichenihabitans sp.]